MKNITILFFAIISFCSFVQASVSVNADNNDSVEKIIKTLNTPSDSDVLVAAHRGDWRNSPENSLQAIKNCIKLGVDIVEIDVRITKDSALVLIHDATLDRTTTGKGLVSEWSLDSLRTLYLRNGQLRATSHKIATLEEAMQVAKGHILVNLDKCSGYMDLAYQILKQTGTVGQVIFKGTKDIDHVRKQYGGLLDEIIYMPIIKKSTPQLEGFVDDFLIESKPVAFEVLYETEESFMFSHLKEIKSNDCRVWVNTLWESLCAKHDDDRAVDNPDESWGWVIEHGANIIQTDRPALLLEYLREKGLHE